MERLGGGLLSLLGEPATLLVLVRAKLPVTRARSRIVALGDQSSLSSEAL
eukprot:CAMPEP_0204065796 /NCGR_PEP_ID=MMETSP0360-20130528/150836_1 /ASSEMBLY_ACC=CAM_ASM_000342 /TAXON_ID=268821 /ORGANISM="Scrippsiella Hangoei, Strain SHTV-5" /LENGTH=49 /DNA_ID=CAMNT_0051013805 /DNA_START=64 /DNA_END=213 /DNA_ORIENTATION=-